jgi:hypothetical protein
MHRVFSRIVVIPFNKIAKEQSLTDSLTFQTEMKPHSETVISSIGIILELSVAFATMRTDILFQEVLEMYDCFTGLDMRAQFNYSLLMFSTGKVCHTVIV